MNENSKCNQPLPDDTLNNTKCIQACFYKHIWNERLNGSP